MYMGTMQIPIPPPSLKTKIGSRNKTIDLLEKGQVNVIRSPALTEISFRFMLPNSNYPFSQQVVRGMVAAFLGASDGKAPSMIDELEKMKNSGEPFQFIVVRLKDGSSFINMMNEKVTLESYSIEKSADEGYDMYADVTLKAFKDYGAKRITVLTDSNGNKTGSVQTTRSTIGHSVPTTSFSIKPGETLAQGCKRVLLSAEHWSQLAALNKIAVSAVLTAGQMIGLRRKVEKPIDAMDPRTVMY
jgi:hypothetical protein